METELKLRIAQPDLVRVSQHPLLTEHARAIPHEHRLTDTYYDTPRLELWRHGVTLRVRGEAANKEGTKWIQTVKTASAGSAALHQRGEWESAVPSIKPQPAEIARQVNVEKIARLLESSAVVKNLRPIFTNTTLRTIWDLELPDGQQVECALDSGNINCEGQTITIGELELELKKGNPTQLFELALALHEDIPLQIANDSKAARGYALLEKRPPPAVKATPVRLTRRMHLEDAFRTIGLNCLQQMEANVPGVLSQSVEGLHQMRVGLRRLRALLDMFSALAPLQRDARDGVEWLANELGATRDWDVLATSTLDRMTKVNTGKLKELATRKAFNLHQALLVSLNDPRYTQLLLQLNGWFYGRHWRSEKSFSSSTPLLRRVNKGMPPLLQKAQKRLIARIAQADPRDATTLHRVRIAAKKARYAAEFFVDLLPPHAAAKYIARLSHLQDSLGSMNDLEVAKSLLSKLDGAQSAPDVHFALGYLSSQLQSSMQGLSEPLHSARRLKMPIDK